MLINNIVIEEKQLKSLDINDIFFDSLKSEYKDFTTWFNNHLNRKVYVTYQNNKITSLLVLKIEDELEIYNNFY